MNIVDELFEVTAALHAADIRYALCGGLAVTPSFEAGTARERLVQRVSKLVDGEHICVDLLVARAAFDGLLDDKVALDFDGRRLSVISRAGLIRMKTMAGRDQDLADIARLEADDER